LKRVPITGGAPVTLHEGVGVSNFPQGLTWPTPDTILFTNAEGVVRIPANGGAAEVLVARAEDERFYSPQLLPAGDALLFTRVPGAVGTPGGFEAAQVVVQSISGSDRTVVWEGGSAARYLSTGHLVYAQGATLFAIPFDVSTRAVRGGPVPLLQGLRRSRNGFTDAANYAVADTGTLALIPAPATARIETTLAWVDRNGREEPLPARPDDYTIARISPDGTRIALVVGAALGRVTPPTIWIYDLRTENLSLLTTTIPVQDGPVWSADGSRLFFRSLTDDSRGVHAIELTTGEATLLAAAGPDSLSLPWALAPGEERLAVISGYSGQGIDIATLSLADGEFAPLLAGEGNQNEPSISSDGAWLAYAELPPGGTSEINIRSFPAVSRTRIPVGPGSSPVFSRDGSELFFFDGRGIATAPIVYEPTLRVGSPRRLFESDAFMWALYGRTWDPDPSGDRFLVIRDPASGAEPGAAAEPPRIDVVLNWFEELKRRVPTE
jgi:Tol biopolymer transport system component